jgi:hypothetical protein
MCRIITTVVLSLVALGIVSCAHYSTPQVAVPDRNKWVYVGGIPPIFEEHVRETLQQAGIPSFCEGSIAYDVVVPVGTEARAAALLRADAELRDCSGQMYMILYAASLWPSGNGSRLPSDFRWRTNDLRMLKILICPGDHLHEPATSWASFTTNDTSYEIVAPGIYKTDTNVVYLRCKIHGYVGYSYGRVLDDSGRLLIRSQKW